MGPQSPYWAIGNSIAYKNCRTQSAEAIQSALQTGLTGPETHDMRKRQMKRAETSLSPSGVESTLTVPRPHRPRMCQLMWQRIQIPPIASLDASSLSALQTHESDQIQDIARLDGTSGHCL
jgi:hypothetical protein